MKLEAYIKKFEKRVIKQPNDWQMYRKISQGDVNKPRVSQGDVW